MEIQQIQTNLLTPDKNQPRQEINDEDIKAMSVSLKNEGIINPIEIDKNNVIITGEMRWRAAKLAGFETVPVKVLEIDDNKRFIRQMQENLHHNTMSAWDTAKGYEKTAKILGLSFVPKKTGRPPEMYQEELHKIYGTPISTISQFLSLLSESVEIQEALKKFKIKRSKIREANFTFDKTLRNRLKNKILKEPKTPERTVRYVAKTLNRSIRENKPEKAKEILKENYEDVGVQEAQKRIDKIYPTGVEILEKSGDRMKKILDLTNELQEYFKNNPLDSFASFDAQNLKVQLTAFATIIKEYLSVRES